MLFYLFIGFVGGIIFLASFSFIFCAAISKKWIDTDIDTINWDESSEQIHPLYLEVADRQHKTIDFCQNCQQISEKLGYGSIPRDF
jgi:hypothetical protein